MTRNYFTGKEIDKEDYTEVDRINRLCISYNIMEPMEDYDEDDPKRRTRFTKSFQSFERDVFMPLVMGNKELLQRSANSDEFFIMLITFYVCSERVNTIKFKDHPEGGFDVTLDAKILADKTLVDIHDMAGLVAGLKIMSYDHSYQQKNKILERMIDLKIIKRHGEFTTDFKLYLERYCRLSNKTISELGIFDYEHNEIIVPLIADFIGMSIKEFKKINKLKHRLNEAIDLDQMAVVVKQCLKVKGTTGE